MTAEVADIGLFNKALATNLKGSAEKVILFGLDTEPKCVHAVDTWQGILSDYPSFQDVRTVWVGGTNVEASATLGASGIPCGAFVRMHFVLDGSRLLGGMMQGTNHQPSSSDHATTLATTTLEQELQESSHQDQGKGSREGQEEQKSDWLPEDGIQLGHLYRAKEQKKVESSKPLQDSPAEQVKAPVSGVCTKFRMFITSIKQALTHLFEVGLTPIAIMVSTIVMLFVWPKSSDFDGDTCMSSNEGNDFMMIATLVESCDCVQTELEDAYLNVSWLLLRCMCGLNSSSYDMVRGLSRRSPSQQSRARPPVSSNYSSCAASTAVFCCTALGQLPIQCERVSATLRHGSGAAQL